MTDLYDTDLVPVFTSRFDDFELYEDGEWRVWMEGRVIASGAFNYAELDSLAEHALRIRQSKVGMHDNDRYGAQ